MRAVVRWILILGVSVASYGLRGQDQLTALQIAERAARTDAENVAAIRSFTVVHRYTLDNPRFNRHAEMSVRVTYHPKQGKTIEVLSGQNFDGMQKHVFQKVMEAEKESSRPEEFEQIRVSPRNYTFTLAGTEVKDSHPCYVLKIQPKHRNHFLLEGKVWISKNDFGIVRLEGRPKERVSFWVGRPDIVQTFCKVGGVWMQASTRSKADVVVAGRSEFLIESFDFKVQYLDHDKMARATSSGSRAGLSGE